MARVDSAERLARMVVSGVAEPGDIDACALVHEHTAHALVSRLRSGQFTARSKVAAWAARLAATDPDSIAAAGVAAAARFVCPGDAEWPVGVDDLAHHGAVGERRGGRPFGLWVRGSGQLADLVSSSVAVVGARASTAYGDHVAGDLAYGCSEQGLTVVSGGAYGIDASAHRGALAQGGHTIAVLAGGIDRFYPAGNTQLLRTIARDGVLVSEAGPGCAPTRSRFLVRNRLIAALSQGTIVVEAAVRSGSLNTARWASDLNRLVMGIPGPVTSQASAGVHQLLRQPEALLVTDAGEVVEHLSPVGAGLAPRKQAPVTRRDLLDAVTRRVLECTEVRGASATTIAREAEVTVEVAEARLAELGRQGFVTSGPEGWTLA